MKKTRTLQRNDGWYEPQVNGFFGWEPAEENYGHGEVGGVGFLSERDAIEVLDDKFGKNNHDYQGLY